MVLHTTLILAADATEKAGLFDFDATLPLIAIQFLLLAAVLNAIFFQPVTQVIDGRSEYVRSSLAEAREKLQQTESLTQQYESALSQARVKSQQLIAEAEASALKIRTQRLAEVQLEVNQKLETARQTIEAEKQQALQQLENQVAGLTQQVIAKLLA